MEGLRILVVSALAGYVEPLLKEAFRHSEVTAVTSPESLLSAVQGRPRFDVALVELLWNHPRYEWTFDGLDTLRLLRDDGRAPAVVVRTNGYHFEHDHLAEALDERSHPDVVGAVAKAEGLEELTAAIETVAKGGALPRQQLRNPTPLHHYFATRRGRTAARLAAAIASGRASHYESLAAVANVAPATASKLSAYLAPLITARDEAPPEEAITQASIYRWCGEHARYLLSWQRRDDPENAISRWDADSEGAETTTAGAPEPAPHRVRRARH